MINSRHARDNHIVEGGSRHLKGLKLFTPPVTEANTDYNEGTRNLLLSRSRNLYNSNSVADAAVSRLQENVIGCGLKPKSKIDLKPLAKLGLTMQRVKDLQEQFELDFHMWAKSKESDSLLQTNFYTKSFVAFTTYLICGESFANIDYRVRGGLFNTCCQLIESERVSNPNNSMDTEHLKQGVQLNQYKEIEGYWVTDAHPADAVDLTQAIQWKYYKTKGYITGRTKTFQVIKPKREGQLRGVGIFAPIMNDLKQLSRANENELLALVLQGMLTFYSYSTDSAEKPLFEDETTEEARKQGIGDENLALGGGSYLELPDGRKLEMVNPTRPNSTYQAFIDFMTVWIGASLGIPSEVLSLRFNTSYTAARAAFIQVAKIYENYGSFFGGNFCQHYYEAIIDEGVASGRYDLPGYKNPFVRAIYCNAIWQVDGLAHIDEVKQSTSASIRIQNKITSLRYEREKMGIDHDLIEQQLEEQEKRHAVGGGGMTINFNEKEKEDE